MKITSVILSLVVVVLMSACKSKAKTISGYYNYATECVGKGYNGSQIVKTWGIGLSQHQAETDARIKAVDEILFKGIRNGSSDCLVRPLVSNPNAKRDHELYFNQFFSFNGGFQNYVTFPAKNWLERKLEINPVSDGKTAYELVVEVDMIGLKSHLQKDNIIQ
ncbi:hypothetical protein P700755_001252 [Psychroflexus torquis ATCC 700755]|jgi:hypothetical protein|uniref:Lipoprotein n=1 Tax=Psychroflexus torquis (strain ATCC 700755 / CIP 106069 / ACAM 623) TaxID=313595 RepID=K4ICQ2_PSYTT|nr:hypothetical protein [Psychroflexus torquis]AFU68189.1 hypothetical protein P700755_001252 [Psychroflexus torquis ATCC 700755]